jgi:DNA repair exonuclease SbcCD ATPase subunit
VFGEYLDGTEKTMNAFISAYGDLVQVGILNMGQNMDKVRNSINNFYEKALEWNKMSESDKAEFIQDNAELFADDLSTEENEGQILLKAFESGDYSAIEEALKNNKALRDQIDQRKKEIAQELKIEEARTGEDRNEAYISQLKKYEAYLNNVEDLFKASLEVRLEQEENQLDEYKSYLEDQREALEESLEKRKEAYEKYFDAINENEEDEEYEEEAEKLVSNLSKLGSSTSATSEQKAQEIEQKLEELEEERLKELRERSQEAILEKMDDDLEEISKKFDDLLENNRALLAAMQGELDNPVEYIGKLLTNKADSGASALEIESYIQTLQGTYGSVLGNRVDWDNINVREENNQVILNVHGKEIILNSTDEQNLYETIMTALTAIGGN